MNKFSNLSSSWMPNLTSASGEGSPNHFLDAILATNIMLGLPANSYILWFSIKKKLQKEILFPSLAVNEIIFCIGSVLILLNGYIFSNGYSKIILFFGEFLQLGRPLFQSCICIERYMAVVHPIIFRKYKSLRYKILGTVVIWVLIFSYNSVVMLTSVYIHLYLLLALYMVIFPLKVFCCLMVMMVLKQPGPSDRKKDGKIIQKSKVKAFRIIFMVLVSSLLTYIPTVSVLALLNIVTAAQFQTAWGISLYIAITAGFLQPLIYMHNSISFSFCKSL